MEYAICGRPEAADDVISGRDIDLAGLPCYNNDNNVLLDDEHKGISASCSIV